MRLPDLDGVGVGDPHPLDDPVVDQALEGAHRLGVRVVGVGPVVLVERDRVDTQPAGGVLGGLPEPGRVAVDPPVRAVAGHPALGRHGDLAGVAVRRQGARDQLLVVAERAGVGVVDVRGVDQRHPGVESGVDGRDRLFLVERALQRHLHAAEADRGNGQVADVAVRLGHVDDRSLGAMTDRAHHRPAMPGAMHFESVEGGPDPAVLREAAERVAVALVRGHGVADDALVDRVIGLAETEGLETLAELWSSAAPDTVAGSLWRLYLLRTWVYAAPLQAASEFGTGRLVMPVARGRRRRRRPARAGRGAPAGRRRARRCGARASSPTCCSGRPRSRA